MSWFNGFRELFRTIDGLLEVERKHGAATDSVNERVMRLEASSPVPVAEARAAASAAASAVAAQHIADLARCIGVLEERLRRSEAPDRHLLSDD